MQNKVFHRQFALILCFCGIIAAAEPNGVPGSDANDAWLGSEHLSPGWRVMELTTYHSNPENPDAPRGPFPRRLLFGGQIKVTEPNGLIGLSTVPSDVLVLDETGRTVDTASSSRSTVFYEPPVYVTTVWTPPGEMRVSIRPYDFSVDMWMYPPYPAVLGKVQWSMNVLLSDSFEVVEIPFAPTADWIELKPGLGILVEEAVSQGATYRYRTKARYDPKKISYPCPDNKMKSPSGPTSPSPQAYSWPGAELPEIIVTDIDLLDAEGGSFRQRSTGTLGTLVGADDSGDGRVVTRTVWGTCSACGPAKVIRFVIASAPYERQVQFELENVLIPGF